MRQSFLLLIIVILTISVNAQTEPAKDSLQQFTGKYKFPEGTPFNEVTVTLDKGILTASSALGSSELKKMEGDVFEVVAYGGTATFKRNAENKITGLHILVSDVEATGTKDEGSKSNSQLTVEVKRN